MISPSSHLYFFLLKNVKFLVNFSIRFNNHSSFLFYFFVSNFRPVHADILLKLHILHTFLLHLLLLLNADLDKNSNLQ